MHLFPVHPSAHEQYPGVRHWPPFSQGGSQTAVCSTQKCNKLVTCDFVRSLQSLTKLTVWPTPTSSTVTWVWGYACSSVLAHGETNGCRIEKIVKVLKYATCSVMAARLVPCSQCSPCHLVGQVHRLGALQWPPFWQGGSQRARKKLFMNWWPLQLVE